LDISYEQAEFNNKFLQDCYSTMTARINNILTKESVRSFMGSDFTGRDIITSGSRPISLYLCWPEKDLLSLSPLIQLVYDSLINDMTDTYDSLRGEGCSRTLLVLDEIFRSGMAKLPHYLTTVCGKNISILLSAQSRAQLDAEYGTHKAEILRGQIDTIVIHRPAPDDYETQAHIEKILGYTSGFAHSKNEHEWATSTGESEQKIPLIPAHEIDLMKATEVIIKRSGVRPILADRLDWRLFPELRERHAVPAPELSELPAFDQGFTDRGELTLPPHTSWQVSPELTRRGSPIHATNGFAKKGRGDGR
jgi:type IV secretory pathway TraG/TraD family ATPase VirD4